MSQPEATDPKRALTPEQQESEREQAILEQVGIVKKLEPIRRSTFEKLSPDDQSRFSLAGGQLVDDPPAKKYDGPLADNQIRRRDFDKLTSAEQMDAVKAGKKIVD